MSEPSGDLKPNQTFVSFDSTNLNCSVRNSHEFSRSLGTQSHGMYHPAREVKAGDQIEPASSADKTAMNWEPAVMLRNLSLLEQKIHQVKGILRSITSREGQCSNQANELTEQQKLVTADLTCIVIQLISTAGALLPNVRNTLLSTYSNVGHLGSVMATPSSLVVNNNLQQDDIFTTEATKVSECAELIKGLNGYGGGGDKQEIFLNCSTGEGSESFLIEDHNLKDCDNVMDGANLTPGSYEVLQLEKEEILAPHTHFCSICGKGFKRDANLRMHMRGHGDEYKTPAALAKPTTEASSEPTPIRRYSCPFVGCKRNKEHKKFQPLKTILCMKNHYKRSHCNKSYTCSRCNSKKFSVMADLKTHEKHCGQERWLCSCGTSFSRKDKLFGHVALFHGHTPALSVDDFKASGTSDQAKGDGLMNEMARNMGYNFGGSTSTNVGILDIKCVDDGCDDFLNMDFNSCNFDGFDEFPHPAFEVTDNPFFLPRESCNSIHRNGED